MYTEKHFYLHFWGYIQIFGGAMYPSNSLHLRVQRKWTAFSPRKVVHHAVFCKYYAELAKTFLVLYKKKQNLTGYIQYYKKVVDRHKGHGSERTTLPVWPNVRQKKKVFAMFRWFMLSMLTDNLQSSCWNVLLFCLYKFVYWM
jgi:hypothetical protein